MKVNCDKCGCNFTVVEFFTRKIGEGKDYIQEGYFVCPNCKTEFISFVRNREINILINQVKTLTDLEKKQKILDKIDQLTVALIKSRRVS